MANPVTIYKRFSEIFPNLAAESVRYVRSGNAQIDITMQNGATLCFNYSGKTWKLEKKR